MKTNIMHTRPVASASNYTYADRERTGRCQAAANGRSWQRAEDVIIARLDAQRDNTPVPAGTILCCHNDEEY